MQNDRLDTVWLVGGRTNEVCPDVYADKKHAETVVMGYIQEDHWLVKLTGHQRTVLSRLLDSPELAIEYYNSVADKDSQWIISAQDVRWPEEPDDELPNQ